MSQSFPPPQPTDGNPFGQQPAGGAFAPPVPPARSGNVALAIGVGFLAMIVGAAIYAGLMRAFAKEDGSYVEIGYVAVVVGGLVGFAAGKLGGSNPVLPIVSAVFAVVGVFLGQTIGLAMIASYVYESQLGTSISVVDILTEDIGATFDAWKEEAEAMTYLFLAFGAFAAFGATKKFGN